MYDTLTGRVIAATERSVLVMLKDAYGEPRDVWIPRSLIEDGEKLVKADPFYDGGNIDIEVKSWFCEKEGLI